MASRLPSKVGKKFKFVMDEFGSGRLKSNGKVVTDVNQARAIAFSEQRRSKKRLKSN